MDIEFVSLFIFLLIINESAIDYLSEGSFLNGYYWVFRIDVISMIIFFLKKPISSIDILEASVYKVFVHSIID